MSVRIRRAVALCDPLGIGVDPRPGGRHHARLDLVFDDDRSMALPPNRPQRSRTRRGDRARETQSIMMPWARRSASPGDDAVAIDRGRRPARRVAHVPHVPSSQEDSQSIPALTKGFQDALAGSDGEDFPGRGDLDLEGGRRPPRLPEPARTISKWTWSSGQCLVPGRDGLHHRRRSATVEMRFPARARPARQTDRAGARWPRRNGAGGSDPARLPSPRPGTPSVRGFAWRKTRRQGRPSVSARAIIDRIGVIPMPPAMNSSDPAFSCRPKKFLGRLVRRTVPGPMSRCMTRGTAPGSLARHARR